MTGQATKVLSIGTVLNIAMGVKDISYDEAEALNEALEFMTGQKLRTGPDSAVNRKVAWEFCAPLILEQFPQLQAVADAYEHYTDSNMDRTLAQALRKARDEAERELGQEVTVRKPDLAQSFSLEAAKAELTERSICMNPGLNDLLDHLVGMGMNRKPVDAFHGLLTKHFDSEKAGSHLDRLLNITQYIGLDAPGESLNVIFASRVSGLIAHLEQVKPAPSWLGDTVFEDMLRTLERDLPAGAIISHRSLAARL